MGWLTKILSLRHAKKTTAPGKAVLLKTKASGVTRETEHFQLHGIATGPTPDDQAVEVQLRGGSRVIVATHNYRLEVEVTAGETIIYSTSADGETEKARIKLDTAGNIDLNGDGKTFVTHAELDTALQNFITALNSHTHPTAVVGPPSPPTAPMSLDISAAETTTVRTDG